VNRKVAIGLKIIAGVNEKMYGVNGILGGLNRLI